MDKFEVLVGNYGIKPQKSAPMASIKSGVKTLNSKPGNFWSSTYGSSSRSKSSIDDHDDAFQFNSATGFQKQSTGGFGDFDIGFQFPPESNKFANGASNGGSGLKFDVESMFRDSMNLGTKPSNSNDYDDLFSGFPGKNTSAVNTDDLLSSTPKKIDPVDDLFGNLGGNGPVTRGSVSRTGDENRRNSFDHEDELIPGFGSATATNNGMNQYPMVTKQEPQEASFIDIESSSDNGGQYGTKEDEIKEWNFQAAAPANAEVDLDSFFTAHSGKSSAEMSAATSEVDIDSIFSVPNPNRTTRAGEKPIPVQKTEVDIDSIFSVPNPNRTTKVGEKPILVPNTEVDIDSIFSVPNPNRTTRVGEKPIPVQKTGIDIDSIFSAPNVKIGADTRTNKSKNETAPDFSYGTSSHSRNNLSSSSTAYEFDFFGGSMTSAAFEEIEGEDDERRRARFGRYQRTEARMAQALADMNSREFQAQQEQEERHRIAEIKDSEMKLWAAGKEGNLRALLSSLDQVLWPECGWKALSLADLITSAQVKVAYKKAALYVHPDKVQQKGATAQQKYVAEKVFDLLKEAWNKFNQEELR